MTVTSDQAAFEARIDALSAELDRIKAERIAVGDELPTRYLDVLPYGTQFRDSDGDVWLTDGTGNYAFDAESLADGEFTTLNPKEYAPLSLVRLGETDSTAQDEALADWERELLEGTKSADPAPVFQQGETFRLLPGADQTISAFALGEYPAKVTIHRGPETISRHGVCYDVRAADGNNQGIVQTVPASFLAPVEEPRKPQRGDRVRVVRAWPGYMTDREGYVGTVAAIYGEGRYVVDFEDGQEYDNGRSSLNGCSIDAAEVEILPPVETEPEPEPTPLVTTVNQPIGNVDIFVRPSGATSGARVEIKAGEQYRRTIHLDQEGTAELARVLQAIADR
jgi:hypothetical protein